MDANLFWQLLEDICQLGEFIAAIEMGAGSPCSKNEFHRRA